VETGGQMSVLAPGVRDRSFRTVFRGYDRASVRAALDAAVKALEALEADVARLREQQADAMREMDRMGELERSLLRSCVAAEEDARVRCGAARRYATRVIAAAQEQAEASLEAPTRERDRLAREIEAMVERRREAATSIEVLIAGLQRVPEAEAEPIPASGDAVEVEPLAAVLTAAAADEEAPASGVEQLAGLAAPANEPDVSAVEPIGSSARLVVPAAPGAAGGSEGQSAAPAGSGPRERWLRVPIVAGAAAALLFVLHGSAAVPRISTTPPALAAASFAPLHTETPVPVPRDQELTASIGSSGTPTDAPAAAGLTIHIKPLRRCWVRVIVDGRTDARELQPGEDIVLNARHAIVLRAGDAGALSIEVNGRVLPPLGLDGQVVERRFTAAPAE
jgi:DivIVA domain-containing protein